MPESEAFAVFITNQKKQVPLFHQRAGDESDDGFVCWDYHVVLIVLIVFIDQSRAIWVCDLDSTLPFPTKIDLYLNQTFKHFDQLPSEFQPVFRIINFRTFLRHFSSDRYVVEPWY